MRVAYQSMELPVSPSVFIFGAGRAGELILDEYRNVPEARVVAFIDNAKKGDVRGCPVITFGQFIAMRSNESVVVLASQYSRQMAEQLRHQNIEPDCDASLLASRLQSTPSARYIPDAALRQQFPTSRFRGLIEPLPYGQFGRIGAEFATAALKERFWTVRDLLDWKMEVDDAPLLEALWRSHKPLRHLEFGTWRGFGARLCLQVTSATVWTLNLFEGETMADGAWGYGERFSDFSGLPLGTAEHSRMDDPKGRSGVVRTDAGGMVGILYRKAGLAHRVCQVYCDSRDWDTSNYPPAFFDSVFIDGGHSVEVVKSDTLKSLQVTAPGGLFVWHDFCPFDAVLSACGAPRGVVAAIEDMLPILSFEFEKLYWLEPSWILVGVRKRKAVEI